MEKIGQQYEQKSDFADAIVISGKIKYYFYSIKLSDISREFHNMLINNEPAYTVVIGKNLRTLVLPEEFAEILPIFLYSLDKQKSTLDTIINEIPNKTARIPVIYKILKFYDKYCINYRNDQFYGYIRFEYREFFNDKISSDYFRNIMSLSIISGNLDKLVPVIVEISHRFPEIYFKLPEDLAIKIVKICSKNGNYDHIDVIDGLLNSPDRNPGIIREMVREFIDEYIEKHRSYVSPENADKSNYISRNFTVLRDKYQLKKNIETILIKYIDMLETEKKI